MATDSPRAEIVRLKQRLSEYYTPDEVSRWLRSPHPQLGLRDPCSLIAQGRVDELHIILDRLDAGAYL